MLGKLFKHEWKALSRFLLPIHAILLICSFIGRFLLTPHLYNPDTPNLIIITSISTYIFVINAGGLFTSLFVAIRFYKSLFTDEGYLTWTLPATPGQHLLSRFAAATIWIIIDVLCLALSLLLLFYTEDLVHMLPKITPRFQEVMGVTMSQCFSFYFVLMIFSAPIVTSILYFCIAIGQLFSSHRILGAIITYFCVTIITSLVSFGLLLNSPYATQLFQPSATSLYTNDYLFFIFKITFIISIIEGGISYLVSYYIMNKKINLT